MKFKWLIQKSMTIDRKWVFAPENTYLFLPVVFKIIMCFQKRNFDFMIHTNIYAKKTLLALLHKNVIRIDIKTAKAASAK